MTFPVIFLMGPTASGKTDCALFLADQIPSHIISCDSALIYRDMNIGTAKPSRDLLTDYPHALVDILSPLERYSAEQFRQDARAEIEKAYAKNRLPIVVGGTFLYMKALIEGISPIPAIDPNVRASLSESFQQNGIAPLYEQLKTYDAVSAERLSPNDSQRIMRALEVVLSTEKTINEFWEMPPKEALPYPYLKFALTYSDIARANAQMEARFHQMIRMGFIDEVATLKEKYPELNSDYPSQRAVGYRQIWDYLEGIYTKDEAIERGIIATRQYAKRQRTWLRSEPNLTLINIHETDPKPLILSYI